MIFCSNLVPATTPGRASIGLLRTAPFLQWIFLCWTFFFGVFLGSPGDVVGRSGPSWGLSGLECGGFGRSFSKFSVFIFFTISKLFKPNIDFGFDFGTTCLHNRLCHENPRIDLSYLLRRNLVKTTLPTLRLRLL